MPCYKAPLCVLRWRSYHPRRAHPARFSGGWGGHCVLATVGGRGARAYALRRRGSPRPRGLCRSPSSRTTCAPGSRSRAAPKPISRSWRGLDRRHLYFGGFAPCCALTACEAQVPRRKGAITHVFCWQRATWWHSQFGKACGLAKDRFTVRKLCAFTHGSFLNNLLAPAPCVQSCWICDCRCRVY